MQKRKSKKSEAPKHYFPALHEKQEFGFFSEANEILYGGAAGGGKSHLIRMIAIFFLFKIDGIQIYLFRRHLKDLVKNHLNGATGFRALLKPWVDAKKIKIDSVKKEIRYGNSCIFLCHCKTEHSVYEHQGIEFHILLIDELTHFTSTIYKYLRTRLRCTGIKIPPEFKDKIPFIFAGTNPGNIGHNWVKQTFVTHAPNYAVARAEKEDGGMLRQFIPALITDNPTLLKDDPHYIDRLRGSGSKNLVRALLHGDWNIIEGGMFDDVWDDDTHIITPFRIPRSWRKDRSFDWGSSKPFSVGFWAESDGTEVEIKKGIFRTFPRGSLFRIGEIYGWNGEANKGLKLSSKEICKLIKNFEEKSGYKFEAGVADSSIYDTHDKHSGSIANSFLDENIEWKRANKSPGTRIIGWDLIRERLKNTIENSDSPHFYVFDSCTQFKRTFPVLPRSEKNPDDVDTAAEDHIGDETRYRILDTLDSLTISKIKRGI